MAEPQEEQSKAIEELEEDAKKDSSPKIKDTVKFLTPDTTMNVMPCTVGNMLVSVSEGGMQHLVAGARANVGVKSGRHMFETKIVEVMNPLDESNKKATMFSRTNLRLGFSTEDSGLFLGDDEHSICFDNDGFMINQRKKVKSHNGFKSDVVVAAVLNLDPKSPNFNTVSLFQDGVRATQPQPLPEAMKGKVLFPAITFKNMTVHCNFAAPIVPLPFRCKYLQEATVKDAVVKTYSEPDDGKHMVLFPVSMPDEGGFDWLDLYLERHPECTELSQRAVIAWAAKSGFTTSKMKDTSNDRPEKNLGIPSFDDMSVLKQLIQLATLQPRSFVIMEIQGNLVKEDRAAAIAPFKTPMFKLVADVFVGDPPSSFKSRTQLLTLRAKQAASDLAFKARKLEEKRLRLVRKKLAEQDRLKIKMEKERKKKAEGMKRKWQVTVAKNAKAKEDAAKKAAGEEVKEEEKEEEMKEEKEEESEEEVVHEEAEPMDEDPPKVELSAEEKTSNFVAHSSRDLAEYVMNTSFSKFSLPDADEGFDKIKYSWDKGDKAIEYVKRWIHEKKLTTRVEDIGPSPWFKQKHAQWQTALQLWKVKQNEHRGMVARKAAARAAKVAKKAAVERAAKIQEAVKAKAAEKAKAEAAEKAKAEAADGTLIALLKSEKKEEDKETPSSPEKAKAEVKAKDEEGEKNEAEEDDTKDLEEEEEEVVDFDAVDVFGVEDVCDIGGKVPIFKDFQFEDFTMLTLRFELHLLAHAFIRDVKDTDRTGMHLDHLAFYYQKYYTRSLNFKGLGVESPKDLLDLMDDTVWVTKSIIEPQIPAELESLTIFVRLTEESRRYRALMLELGDESARLKISDPIQAAQARLQGTKRPWSEGQSGQGQKGGGGWKKPAWSW